MTDVAVVLDTSALLAYTQGHVAVGELIAEVSDERRLVGVPATCLAAAHAVLTDEFAEALLMLLVTTPTIVVLGLGGEVGEEIEQVHQVGRFARAAGGDVGVGHAVHAALDHEAHYATARPELAAKVLPAGWSVLDIDE